MLRALASLALVATLATPALAASEGHLPGRNDGQAGAQSVAALRAKRVVANAQFARVALLFDKDAGIIRSKNVKQVRRPAGKFGLYCILPSISISKTTTTPIASPDYSGSLGDGLMAAIRSNNTAAGCRAGEFAVQTTRQGTDGYFVQSSNVGFVFLVP